MYYFILHIDLMNIILQIDKKFMICYVNSSVEKAPPLIMTENNISRSSSRLIYGSFIFSPSDGFHVSYTAPNSGHC